ncbi:hypothetical protein A2U01_0093241, partial [Trifolium medium]|nr:hypothetical protein [Trifolium medium]
VKEPLKRASEAFPPLRQYSL